MTFPTDLLPEPINSYVDAAAMALDCDPAYVATPLLAALASAIGNTRRIRLKKSWTEPAVIWASIVGDSGTVKSPAFELATRPLWRRQRKLLDAHFEARAEYDALFDDWKTTKKSMRGEPPDPPAACAHPICVDITVEALADRLLSTPRGILVAPDELAAWFGGFNQYKAKGSDVSHWLAMHGARALKVDRKSGDKTTIYIPNAAVCLTGTIQPATLRAVLSPEFHANGLAARLLVAMPKTRMKQWTEDEIPECVATQVDDLFDSIFDFRPTLSADGQDEPRMIDLSADAREVWIHFVNHHNSELQQLDTDHERAVWAKLEGYAARFALIIHCIKQAAGAEASDIGVADIEAGVTLALWFGGQARRVYFAVKECEQDRQRRDLLEWIARRGGQVTAREVQHKLSRYPTSDDAERGLQELVDGAHGSWVNVRAGERGGRPTRLFCMAESPDFQIIRRTDTDKTKDGNGQAGVVSVSVGGEV